MTVLPFDGERDGAVARAVESDLGQRNRVSQDVDVEVLLVGAAQGRHSKADH